MDIAVENHGSLFLFRPVSQNGQVWLQDHTDGMWFGGALAVEPRYAEDLAIGAQSDGLLVN